ncbi:MAG: CRTAC1 family protein, partial [Gemmatales bacterium]|nr:CRTAC1 family protein [Gemmatales bacterium]
GDLNGDGRLDLIVGIHFAPSRVHVYLHQGVQDGVPQFREITQELGLPLVPQKTPHTEIQDFDNDGRSDLYWSAWFAQGDRRWPFLCRNVSERGGLPKFLIPDVQPVRTEGIRKNVAPSDGLGMVYYVDSPAVDYNGDGRLDLFVGMWPPEGSRLFSNETPGGNWLQVRVINHKGNRMGIGAVVRIFEPGQGGQPHALLGHQEITVNGGYSSGRPALVHFGLGKREEVDVLVRLPGGTEPILRSRVRANQLLTIEVPK